MMNDEDRKIFEVNDEYDNSHCNLSRFEVLKLRLKKMGTKFRVDGSDQCWTV